ncbi:MAG: tail fiber domain-containing protein [Candidatus Aenigmatarchaeota archaeon]
MKQLLTIGTIAEKSAVNPGIGDTSPDYKLDVWGTICQDTDSNDVCDGTVTSDLRLKQNITIIPNALEKIEQLRGIYFYWNSSINATEHLGRGERQIGLVAQEVQQVLPELIYEDMDGYKMIDYQKVSAVLTEAVKELKEEKDSEIAGLKKENEVLKKELSNLREDVQKLKILANGSK